MSKKYNKVTDIQVLKGYYERFHELNKAGFWCDYLPCYEVARVLQTSKYQVRRAFRNLRDEGYMKLIKYPTYCEDYDNGLYTVANAILTTNVYEITEKGIEKARELCNGKGENR